MMIRASRSLFAVLVWLAYLAGIIAGTSATAGPYDAFSARPGDRIVNSIAVEYGRGGRAPIIAEDTFPVYPFDLEIRLEAHRPDPGGVPTDILPTGYAPSGGLQGPFTSLPAPEARDGSSILLSDPVSLLPTGQILHGDPLFLILDAQGLNFHGDRRDTIALELADSSTSDVEILELHETGRDTGIFAGYIQTIQGTPVSSNGELSTLPRSEITATYSDPYRPEIRIETQVAVGPLDPFGIIFDSQSGAPINGVRITLVHADTGMPAQVLGDDLLAIYPSTVVSGDIVIDSNGTSYQMAPGGFRFPFVGPGRYRLIVEPPESYVAPSVETEDVLQTRPGAPFALGPGSWLGAFDLAAGAPAYEIDVPLDTAGLIHVTREGSSEALEPGDFIEYTVTLRSNVDHDISAGLIDILPDGLRMLEDTLRIEGAPAPSGPVRIGREFLFPGLTIPAGEPLTLTYVAGVGPQAVPGETLTSSSRARAERMISNTAIHDLDILSAFGRDADVVLGQVFATGCNEEHDPDIDLSGIRLLMENGRSVTTDADGLFTFRRVPRGGHVIALDPLSLPAGASPVLCPGDPRKAGSALSRFVEARGGHARQVFFHLDMTDGSLDSLSGLARARDVPAAAIEYADFDQDWLDSTNATPGLVFPREGHLPRGRSLDIIVLSRPGTEVRAFLNDIPVDNLHRRPGLTSADGQRRAVRWRGVLLEEGWNRLRVELRDTKGALLSSEERRIGYAHDPAWMEVLEDRSHLESNGRSRPRIVLRLADENGIAMHHGTITAITVDPPFAFHSPDGAIQSTGATVGPDGLVRLEMAPVRAPGLARFTAFGDEGPVSAQAWISTPNRPWILVGFAGGTLAHDSIARHMRAPTESHLGSAGRLSLDGRAAFFAEGVIKGRHLLTLRYDSGLGEQESDFFDIDPEADYIVYGDASREGDATSSQDPLYLRLASPGRDLLYGDFAVDMPAGAERYTRRLTGARAAFGSDIFNVILYAADTSQTFVEDRFPADGTSGPFDLSQDGILRHSETVVIETTDRDRPGAVIDSRTLLRGRDYTIDYEDGRIFLSAPLLSRNADLDPNALVVGYEIEEGKESGMVAGGRIIYTPSPDLRIGATALHEDKIAGSDGDGTLGGLDLSWQINDRVTAEAAGAVSRQGPSNTLSDGISAHSAEIRLRYAGETLQAEGFVVHESTAFGLDNQVSDPDTVLSSGLDFSKTLRPEDPDTGQAGLALGVALSQETSLENDNSSVISDIRITRTRGGNAQSLGLRGTRDKTDGATGESVKLFFGAQGRFAGNRVDYEMGQELLLHKTGEGYSEPARGTLELTWHATERLDLSLGNEIAFGDGSRADIFSLGADYAAWEGARLRLGTARAGASDGSDLSTLQAGADQDIALSETLTLSLGIDHQRRIAGTQDARGPLGRAGLSNPCLEEGFTAWSAGLKRQEEDWSWKAGLEYREGETSDKARLAIRADRDRVGERAAGLYLSLFGEDPETGASEQDHEIKASLAWRPRDRRVAMLEQIRGRYEKDGTHDELRLINSIYYSRRSEAGHQINLRHGLKYSRFGFATGSEDEILHLVGGEYRHVLTDHLDIGAQATALQAVKAGTNAVSAGLSLGLTPFENGWVALGYNVTGFHDEDFSDLGWTDRGFFLQFRLKIDSTLGVSRF